MRFRIASLSLVVALCACGKKDKEEGGPSCRQIVSYMMRMPGLGTFDERAAIEDCRVRNLTGKERRCLYTAKDVEAMSKCVPPMKLKEQRVKPPKLPDWHTPLHTPIQGKSEAGRQPTPPEVPGATPPAPPAPPVPAAPPAAPGAGQ